jgi:mono/diheme cytochrome c family protein
MTGTHRSRRPPVMGGLLFGHPTLYAVLGFLCILPLACSGAAADDEAAARGERLYNKYCATCHGDDLQNNSGVAFDLRRLKPDEHARFVNSVLHGKNAMPSWQGVLAPPQLEDLWAYIREHANPP